MISIRNVSKSYNKIPAVKNFSLEIDKGEFCVLLGPSGCGKSTTIKFINSLVIPDEGEIYFDGKNIREYKEDELRRKIGYVIQSVGLFPHYSVYENISVVPSLFKWPKKQIDMKVDEMLELVGLDKNVKLKFPHELSGGESQRVGVARALAGNPDVVLMDEPFGFVDPLRRELLQNEFLKIQKALNKTILFVTHDVDEAVRLADRIVIMKDGGLIKQGKPLDFIDDSKNSYINEFLGDDFALKLLARYKVSDCKLIKTNENKSYVKYELFNDKVFTNCNDKLVKNDISVIEEDLIDHEGCFNISINASLNTVLSKMIIARQKTAVVYNDEGSVEGVLTMENLLDTIKNTSN